MLRTQYKLNQGPEYYGETEHSHTRGLLLWNQRKAVFKQAARATPYVGKCFHGYNAIFHLTSPVVSSFSTINSDSVTGDLGRLFLWLYFLASVGLAL